MKLCLIAALAENRVIGDNNRLPWHLPADLKYFKQVTMAKPVIMGRKTYESIGKPLPGRTNIVISRQQDYQPPEADENTLLVHDLDAAVCAAKDTEAAEAMIIGGAEIYRQSLSMVDCLFLTEVQASVSGDAFFPEYDQAQWQLVSSEQHNACERNPYPYRFAVYERL